MHVRSQPCSAGYIRLFGLRTCRELWSGTTILGMRPHLASQNREEFACSGNEQDQPSELHSCFWAFNILITPPEVYRLEHVCCESLDTIDTLGATFVHINMCSIPDHFLRTQVIGLLECECANAHPIAVSGLLTRAAIGLQSDSPHGMPNEAHRPDTWPSKAEDVVQV